MALRKRVRDMLGGDGGREESAITSGAARDRAAPEDDPSARDRLSSAKRTAKRKLGGRPESAVTAGAKRDQTARRGVRDRLRDLDREDARRAARAAAERVEADPIDTSVNQDGDEVAQRAERAATMADPMNTTLEPADPQAVESLATAGSEPREQGEQPEPMFDWSMSDPMQGGSAEEPDDGLLDFGGDAPEDPLDVDDDVVGFGGGRRD